MYQPPHEVKPDGSAAARAIGCADAALARLRLTRIRVAARDAIPVAADTSGPPTTTYTRWRDRHGRVIHPPRSRAGQTWYFLGQRNMTRRCPSAGTTWDPATTTPLF